MSLTPKQKKFADYFLKLGNATEAAKKAGYSKKTAGQIGEQNLKKLEVKAYIEQRQQQASSKRIADITEVMEFYSGVMRGEVKDQFDLDAAITERLSAGKELMRRFETVEKLNQKNTELEKELQKAKLELIKAQAEKIKDSSSDENDGVVIINDV